MNHLAIAGAASLLAAAGISTAAQAKTQRVTVTVENVEHANGIAFAPLRVGFNNGTFDSFNLGHTAGAPIISIAEGGSGADWFTAFAAADPGAVLGTVGGLSLAGQSATANFIVDPALNPFFSFAAMVVPRNDFFIGNDNPMGYRLFDASGNLAITSINQSASQIWNAGSEAFDSAAAAFIQGGVNDLRTPENGVVVLNYAELAAFNGLTTGAGYTFNSELNASSPIYRISFASVAVPEPATWAMLILGFGVIGPQLRRRRPRVVIRPLAA